MFAEVRIFQHRINARTWAGVPQYRIAIGAERLLYRIGFAVTLIRINPIHNATTSGLKITLL